MRDHEPIIVQEFKGTFDKNEDDVCPPGYFLDSLNVCFIEKGVETRKGTSLLFEKDDLRRASVFDRQGEASRLLLLDGSGNLWDSTDLSTPILSIAAMTDFSMVSLYNRAYITPHNGLRGLPGESLYVYEGSGTARVAAGTAPVGAAIGVATHADAGSVEVGNHLFGVVYETSTGHLTEPGPTTFTLYVAPGLKKVALSGIPIGPSGTVARHIIATHVLPSTYAGDAANQEFFFIPDGRIGNNVNTTATMDFFDSDLQSSADWLFDQLATIPAGVGVGVYGSRLMLWGTNEDESRVYGSSPGYPESVDDAEGFFSAFPGDGAGGVKNCIELRDQLYILKSQRTYATQDNLDSPATWKVTSVDQAIGTECHGIGKVLDLTGTMQDLFVVADRNGLFIYNGTYSGNLVTGNIQDIWDAINKAAFHRIEVVIDPIRSLVYVTVPLDAAAGPSHLLVGDFQNGASAEEIRWTIWTFPNDPVSIVVNVDNTTKESVLQFASEDGNVYEYDEDQDDDYGTAISSFVKFPLLPELDDCSIRHFCGVNLRVIGSGTLDILLASLDAAITNQAQSIVLQAAPGRPIWKPFTFAAERCSVRLSVTSNGDWFRLTQMTLYAKPLWAARAD